MKYIGLSEKYYFNNSVKSHNPGGLSLIELLIAVAIFSLLVGIAVPALNKYQKELDIVETKEKIFQIQTNIEKFYAINGRFPDTLFEIGMHELRDPWGTQFFYFNIAGADRDAMNKNARRDKHLRPVNSDFDLYSSGPDKITKAPFSANSARDDIVRCNNGQFIGFAKDY